MDVTRLITTFRTNVSAVRVTLWEGEYNTSNQSDSQNSFSHTQTLSDSLNNYDQIEITIGSVQNVKTSIFDKDDVLTHRHLRISCFSNTSYYATICVKFVDDKIFGISWADTAGFSETFYIYKIVGIKYIQPYSYSTDEKLIGSWVDGKHLYQKTYNINVIADGSVHCLEDIPADIDTIVEISGCINTSSSTNFIPINCYYDSNSTSFVNVDNGKLKCIITGWSGNLPAHITIKYTKK